jgi:uncharacterized hydrophobic protein (TIGR00271 family)
VVHLRIVAPSDRAQQVIELLEGCRSVVNVIVLPDVARKPAGHVILCDVAREDASVVVADLKQLGLFEEGSIAMDEIDILISRAADEAEQAAEGAPADAVVWEDVEQRTSEESKLSGSFALFMVLAQLIAAVGIYLDTPILIVGAMVVGPEFGPIAGLCVALIERRPRLALRSLTALVVGFPVGIAAVWLVSLVFKATGVTPETFSSQSHHLSVVISNPDFLAFFVAFCAGVAGMVSLSTAKSGALIGVLISVTTIPAAANVGVALAYHDGPALRGSLAQLGINLGSILVAGVLTLGTQRLLYERRRRRHRRDVTAAPTPRASS